MFIDANTQLTGGRQGRQLGLISCILEATKLQGAEFDGASAPHQGWGLYRRASSFRLIQALTDVRSLSASLHVLAWESEPRPIKMIGAQTPFSIGWIASYLFGFAAQLPIECDLHLTHIPSTGSSGNSPHMKRRSEEM